VVPAQTDAASALADLIRNAAATIRTHGYNPSSPADSGPGYSASSALCAAICCNDPHLRHSLDCEDLHRRIVGYLYLTGHVTTLGTYAPLILSNWEEYRAGVGYQDQEEVLTVFERTAAILDGYQAQVGSRAAEAELARLCTELDEARRDTQDTPPER
jgi:hypothetical protein